MNRLHVRAFALVLGVLVSMTAASAQTVRLDAREVPLGDYELAAGILNSMTGPDLPAAGGQYRMAAYRVSHFVVGSAVGLYVDRLEQNAQGTYTAVQRKLLVYADEAGVPEPEGPGGASILPALQAPLVRWTSPTSFVYRVWDGREVDPPTYHNYLVEGVDRDTFTVRRAR